MADVTCPGVELTRDIYMVDGAGSTSIIALINGFLKLVREMEQNQGLKDFMEKKCGGDCWRRLSGPDIRRFTSTLTQIEDGTWKCHFATIMEFRIDCREKVPVYISNEDLMCDLLAQIKLLEQGADLKKC